MPKGWRLAIQLIGFAIGLGLMHFKPTAGTNFATEPLQAPLPG